MLSLVSKKKEISNLLGREREHFTTNQTNQFDTSGIPEWQERQTGKAKQQNINENNQISLRQQDTEKRTERRMIDQKREKMQKNRQVFKKNRHRKKDADVS